MCLHTKHELWPNICYHIPPRGSPPSVFSRFSPVGPFSVPQTLIRPIRVEKDSNHEVPLIGSEFISMWCVSLLRRMKNVSLSRLIAYKNVFRQRVSILKDMIEEKRSKINKRGRNQLSVITFGTFLVYIPSHVSFQSVFAKCLLNACNFFFIYGCF